MALIKCKECGKEVSDTAKKCINCGAKLECKKKKYTDLIVGIAILLVLVIIIVASYVALNYSQVAHKYSKEAISVLTDYKERKITKNEAQSELEGLYYKAKIESNEKEDDIKLNLILSVLNKISKGMESTLLDRLDVENYIKELKEF